LPEVPPIVVAIERPSPDPVLPPPEPATVRIAPSDGLGAAIAARLSDDTSPLHRRLARKEREALTGFYTHRGFEPVWLKDGAWNGPARTVLDRLDLAAEDGLDPIDYRLPTIGVPGREPSPGDLAEAELKLSALAALYARDARGARIEPSRLSRLITPTLELPAADEVLSQLAAAPDPGQALAAYHPPHEGYRALKGKLAEIRPPGDALASRREHSGQHGALALAAGRHGRAPCLGNIPEYKLRLVRDGRTTYEARVIVGKPDTQTPVFSDEMDHAVVNPSWYVPPSIFKNEFHSDPAYAASRGYEVQYGKNGAVSIRQPPGERNALGFIKFMFPNQHAVYLHDTPNRKLFGPRSAPSAMAACGSTSPSASASLCWGRNGPEARLKSLIGRGERSIRLPQKVQVHLTYFTVFVDERGELREAADLYAVNNKVRVALGLPSDGTVVAQAKPIRPAAPPPASRPRVQPAPGQQEAAAGLPVRRTVAAPGQREAAARLPVRRTVRRRASGGSGTPSGASHGGGAASGAGRDAPTNDRGRPRSFSRGG
jgi:murein L,D-transpeptidase YcbB/YkuD